MALDVRYQHPVGTRAALNALATTGGLLAGEVYSIADEQRLAVALTTATYAMADTRGLSGGISGKAGPSEVVVIGIAPYSITPTSAGSSVVALEKATLPSTTIIRRGKTQIGSYTFGAEADVAVINWTGSIVKGDAVNLLCPATPDATLADQHLFFGA